MKESNKNRKKKPQLNDYVVVCDKTDNELLDQSNLRIQTVIPDSVDIWAPPTLQECGVSEAPYIFHWDRIAMFATAIVIFALVIL